MSYKKAQTYLLKVIIDSKVYEKLEITNLKVVKLSKLSFPHQKRKDQTIPDYQ